MGPRKYCDLGELDETKNSSTVTNRDFGRSEVESLTAPMAAPSKKAKTKCVYKEHSTDATVAGPTERETKRLDEIAILGTAIRLIDLIDSLVDLSLPPLRRSINCFFPVMPVAFSVVGVMDN